MTPVQVFEFSHYKVVDLPPEGPEGCVIVSCLIEGRTQAGTQSAVENSTPEMFTL